MWYKLLQESQQGGNRSRAGTPHQPVSPLADPPAVKELLRAEVKMLLQNLREKASSEGRSVQRTNTSLMLFKGPKRDEI